VNEGCRVESIPLAACSTADIEPVRLVEINFSPFAKAVSREYCELAVFEAGRCMILSTLENTRGVAWRRLGGIQWAFVLSDWNLQMTRYPN
jgi:hypothetical protein